MGTEKAPSGVELGGKSRGLSQGELGSRIGKSTATISKIESGSQAADMLTFLALTEALEISPATVLLKSQVEASRLQAVDLPVVEVMRQLVEALETGETR
jgi:transcriptional regulator with XRE-family HTH domain